MGRGSGLRSFRAVAAAVVLSVAVAAMAAAATPPTAGPQPDGTAITPQGWRVTPAGAQTNLGLWPMDVAISPTGNLLLVANAGYAHHSLAAVDPATGAVLQVISAAGAKSHGWWDWASGHPTGYYVGLAFAQDGRHAWASDGPGGAIHAFRITGRTLTETQHIKLTGNRGNDHAWPAGIAVGDNGNRLYVAGNLDDTLRVVDPASRSVLATVAVGHLPYGVALNAAGTRAFVTNWGASSVSVIDTSTDSVVRTVGVGMHPCSIVANPVGNELYVANGDGDSVTVLDGTTGSVLRTIDLRPYPAAPVGAMPDGLTVSPDGTTLYVAMGGDDDVAVVELGSAAMPDHVAGLIPTAWYPSGVAVAPSGRTLFAINMKGLGAGPHLDPTTYWPAFMHGTLSTIPVPDAAQLAAYTAQVSANDRFGAPPTVPSGSVIPSAPGDATPITHVIYVMKENRTYDQILGDLGKGNGDPSLAIFGQDVTPNQHALARRFVTFDNFYADAEVSADGWSWTTGAYANGYIQRNWPVDYNGYGRPYDFGGFGEGTTAGLPGEHPGRGFLWDQLAAAGVPYRNFGFFVDNPVDLQPSIPGLLGHTDPQYPGWDLMVPDQVRIDRWLHVFQGYQARGSMPTMQFVYLPSDHTAGTTPRARRPDAMVADNDLALGRLVEAVSHSSFWGSTAIFSVEDDAQDGPDHVDAHRSTALVISPYTQTGAIDSTFYSSVSVLRTMELVLGVPPMSQFDAVATPMSAAFSSTANLRPYTAVVPGVSLFAKNTFGTPMATASLRIDFSDPDLIPMRLMNRILWKAMRGPDSRMPSPVHSIESVRAGDG
ncbi:MAG: phosphoesterase [Actinobacteria bacterium]|nr:MAG: phosphoesterase [Actinomycetota bacterium]